MNMKVITVAYVALIVLMAVWVVLEAAGAYTRLQGPVKPCEGCSDADLGLTITEPGGKGLEVSSGG